MIEDRESAWARLELLASGFGYPSGFSLAKDLEAVKEAGVRPVNREVVRKALYEALQYYGTLPEPEGDVPERYHKWDYLGEIADRLITAMSEQRG